MSRPSASRSTRFFYGLGAIAFGVKDNGFAFFLLLFYNQVMGLPEERVGLAIMIALLVDAICDPVIGHLSDHLHSRWGRRHPFMYFAVLPVAASYLFLWRPPTWIDADFLFVWLLGVAILVRILIAFYEIPSTALAAELTDHYDERTALLGMRFFFGWWGGLTMSVLAYAVFLQPDATHPVGQLNADGYRGYGVVSALVMATAMLVSALGTHGYIPWLRKPPVRPERGVGAAVRETLETLSNRSFLAIFAFAIFSTVAAGMTAALNLYFNTYFWGLTSSQILVLVLANFVAAVIAVILSRRLSHRVGKKRGAIALSLCAIAIAPIGIGLRLLDWFPANGSPWLLPLLLIGNTLFVTLVIASTILSVSMVADVVEDSEVSTGRRSEGVFFAATAFVQKAGTGVGIFASTLLLRAIDFPRGAKPGEVDPEVVRNLGLVYIPLVVTLYLIGTAFLSAYRINRAGHEENLRKLAKTG